MLNSLNRLVLLQIVLLGSIIMLCFFVSETKGPTSYSLNGTSSGIVEHAIPNSFLNLTTFKKRPRGKYINTYKIQETQTNFKNLNLTSYKLWFYCPCQTFNVISWLSFPYPYLLQTKLTSNFVCRTYTRQRYHSGAQQTEDA